MARMNRGNIVPPKKNNSGNAGKAKTPPAPYTKKGSGKPSGNALGGKGLLGLGTGSPKPTGQPIGGNKVSPLGSSWEHYLRTPSKGEKELKMKRAELDNPMLRSLNRKFTNQPGMFEGVRMSDMDKFLGTWMAQWGYNKNDEIKALSVAGLPGGANLTNRIYAQGGDGYHDPVPGLSYDQLMKIKNRLPSEYTVSLNWYDREYYQEIAEAHKLWLNNLFVSAAERANIQQYSGLSNDAAAAFMLSMVRLETDNWDTTTDTILGTFDRPRITSNLQFSLADIASHLPVIEGIQHFLDVQKGLSDRVSGVSFGVPNIYMGQFIEAWNFHLDTNAVNIESLGTERGILSHFPRDINEDPFFAMRGLNLILNWAGVRQRIVDAGDKDSPAIRVNEENENFDIGHSPNGEVSAFSLAVTRYTDAVDAAGFKGIATSDRFSAMLAAVEGTPEAAAQLGLTVGRGSQYDINLGIDFIPYTDQQVKEIVDQLRSVGSASDQPRGLSDVEIQNKYPILWQTYQECKDAGNCT